MDIEATEPGYLPGFVASCAEIKNQKPSLRSLWVGFFYVLQEKTMLATPRTPPNSTKTNPAYFESFLDEACRGRLRWQQQPERALMSGVNPVELLQYATGAMKDQERREAESMICRDPWAMGRVTALVKAARDTNSLAADLLRASRQTTNVRHILEKIKERITEVGWEEDPDLGLAYVIHSL